MGCLHKEGLVALQQPTLKTTTIRCDTLTTQWLWEGPVKYMFTLHRNLGSLPRKFRVLSIHSDGFHNLNIKRSPEKF